VTRRSWRGRFAVRLAGSAPYELPSSTAPPLHDDVARDLKLVSELLGHSGIQITADTYTTLFQEVDAAAAEAVAKLVPRAVRTTCAPADKPGTDVADPEPGLGLEGL
jgi:hypothetical protein